jgi:hypothetical protein
VTLDQIDDIELLRKAALLLQEDNKKLVRLIAKMKKELHALRGGDPEQLKLAIADLEQQLAKRNDMLFGDVTVAISRASITPRVARWNNICNDPRDLPRRLTSATSRSRSSALCRFCMPVSRQATTSHQQMGFTQRLQRFDLLKPFTGSVPPEAISSPTYTTTAVPRHPPRAFHGRCQAPRATSSRPCLLRVGFLRKRPDSLSFIAGPLGIRLQAVHVRPSLTQ